jgi:hypothetical protein
MNVKDIRRQRLQQLINERFGGIKLRFAEAMEMKPPHVHRWLRVGKGGQGMEEESARAIEIKLNLDTLWLDQETDNQITPDVSSLLATITAAAKSGSLTDEQAKAFNALIKTTTGSK